MYAGTTVLDLLGEVIQGHPVMRRGRSCDEARNLGGLLPQGPKSWIIPLLLSEVRC